MAFQGPVMLQTRMAAYLPPDWLPNATERSRILEQARQQLAEARALLERVEQLEKAIGNILHCEKPRPDKSVSA
jgi:hypothetical protein